MSPAKENDLLSSSFSTPLAVAPPKSSCPPTLKPLSSMFRLPVTVVPTNYDISVSFNIDAKKYKGFVITDIDILAPTRHICVNSSNLQLTNIKVSQGTDSVLGTISDSDSSIGVVRFDFGSTLAVGKYKLSMDFSGRIRSGLQGVYLNKYTGADGEEKEGLATMFAATEARSFFPCWDQPDVKCSFELRVLTQQDQQLTVLSNMNQIDSQSDTDTQVLDADWGPMRVSRFSKSPMMSTYLLCIVIGQYCALSRMAGNTKISVYAPLSRAEEANFSLNTAVKCIEIFNQFFGIEYCLPKLDLIGLACLSVGAMENWGLVTFRENSLLVESATSSNAQLQAVATIVAHEISHQWFGNLVTMKWWSDLWLNEGFATFMQYYAIDKIFPHFLLWDQFCSDVLIPSLQLDALENSHPIKVEVNNPNEIDEIFDKISYRKGASVIRMLHSVLGEEKFTSGIRGYIQTFKYSNACTQDLWTSLRSASGVDVATLMDCWVSNVGFPIIKVSLATQLSGDVIHVSQERFSAAHKCNDGLLWPVPVSACVQAQDSEGRSRLLTLPTIILSERTAEIPIPAGYRLTDKRSDLWFVKMNPGFVSYYRTEYSRDLAQCLERAVADLSLPAVDRLSTLEDRVSLVLGELGNTVALLRLIAKLHSEDSFLVWKNLSSFFHVLRCIVWSSEELSEKFDRFVVCLMVPCLERLGWAKVAGENHLQSMLRGLLICQLGTRGCTEVELKCQQLFNSWLGDSGLECEVEPGLREVVMKVSMASSPNHNTLDNILKLLDVPQERNRVLHSLGYSRNKDVLVRVLEFSLSPRLRDQEAVMVIESVCQNRLGVSLAWEFFKEHIKEFYARYGHGLFLMSKLIKCVTENFSTEEELTSVSEFFSHHPEMGCERTIRQAKENISLNLYWKNRDLDSVARFLSSC